MITRTLDEALAPITDGCVLAVSRDVSGVAMEATRALIRRGIKHLHLIAADLEPAGRSADRRRLHRDAGDVGSEPRRIRSGAALHCRDHLGRHPHAGRHLPGAARRVPGDGKGVPFMPLRA
jgi:hypothetical protein